MELTHKRANEILESLGIVMLSSVRLVSAKEREVFDGGYLEHCRQSVAREFASVIYPMVNETEDKVFKSLRLEVTGFFITKDKLYELMKIVHNTAKME